MSSSTRKTGRPQAANHKHLSHASSQEEVLTAAVVTVSDSSARGEREDLSGPAVADLLQKHNFLIVSGTVVPDEQPVIEKTLLELSKSARLVVTTGGTGIAPRDVTPEATRSVCEKLLEGVAERMRREGGKKTPYAALSRGLCGVRGRCLILNLPGSPKGAKESLESVIELLPHALELLSGNTRHE